MSKRKFDELDRQRTIKELERQFGVKLSQCGSRRKSLTDESGNTFWVLGGYEEWHGIPKDMIEAERHSDRDGTMVIAKRTEQTIKIFTGPLQPLVCNAGRLPVNQDGDFQFNLIWKRCQAVIDELSEVNLDLLAEVDYPLDEKEQDRKKNEFLKEFMKLSPEQRSAILKSLKEKN